LKRISEWNASAVSLQQGKKTGEEVASYANYRLAGVAQK
jgi:hypothetical protein